jgi:hypothetical protein
MTASRRLVLTGLLALTGCGGGPTGPSAAHPAVTLFGSTAHYVFYAAPGDSVDTAWQEQYHEWVTAALGVGPLPRLEYYKYRDTAHLMALTGHQSGTGFAETGSPRFHTIWPIDNHESVHAIVMLGIGHPPPLFNEGVAVAHQTFPDRGRFTPTWNGTDLHELARGYVLAGGLPALSSLLRGADFFDHDSNVTYPCAGSFVRYVIDTHGLAPFKAYVSSARFEDAGGTTEARFQTAFGRPLSDVWNEWRAWLTE